MKKQYLGLNILVFYAITFFSQPAIQWTTQLGFEVVAVASDRDGNMITTGSTGIGKQNDFDPERPIYSVNGEVFISKVNTWGKFIWARGIKSEYEGARVQGLAVDDYNAVYITGLTSGVTDFDPGPSTFTVPWKSGPRPFICKLNADGDFQWAKVFEPFWDKCCITVSDNCLYLTTTFHRWYSELYKLDLNGQEQWKKRFDSLYVNAIVTDHNKNLCLAGYFYDFVKLTGVNKIDTLKSAGERDIFVLKLDANGDYVWSKRVGANADDEAMSIAVDDFSNILVTGYCSNQVDFNPGLSAYLLNSNGLFDTFIWKLNTDGALQWARRYGSKKDDIGYSVVTDKWGNVYNSGTFDGLADFDAGPNTDTLRASPGVFITKYDWKGNHIWAMKYDFKSMSSGPHVAVNDCGSVYFAGSIFPYYYTCGTVVAKIDGCNIIENTLGNSPDGRFSVFPNPSNGNYFISDNFYDSKKIQIKVFDSFGQMAQFTIAENNLQLLNTSNGVYFLEIRNQNSVSRAKLIVSK